MCPPASINPAISEWRQRGQFTSRRCHPTSVHTSCVTSLSLFFLFFFFCLYTDEVDWNNPALGCWNQSWKCKKTLKRKTSQLTNWSDSAAERPSGPLDYSTTQGTGHAWPLTHYSALLWAAGQWRMAEMSSPPCLWYAVQERAWVWDLSRKKPACRSISRHPESGTHACRQHTAHF